MERTRILALDIGEKRTGIAISDEGLGFAFPVLHIEAKGKPEWLAKLLPVIQELEATKILVGMPLNQYGEKGIDAQRIQAYIALLRVKIPLPVIEWDERFTTVQAERSLIQADISRKNRKQVIDKVAATILLQSYLDSLRFQSEIPTPCPQTTEPIVP